jgi:hypothetical protein
MSIDIPERELLMQMVDKIVQSHWTNPNLMKRGTYQSEQGGRDLIPGVPPNISVDGIRSFLCIYDEDSTYSKMAKGEERRPLNDCVTEFVTSRFFEQSVDRIRFIMLVSIVYERFFKCVCAQINRTTNGRFQIPHWFYC